MRLTSPVHKNGAMSTAYNNRKSRITFVRFFIKCFVQLESLANKEVNRSSDKAFLKRIERRLSNIERNMYALDRSTKTNFITQLNTSIGSGLRR